MSRVLACVPCKDPFVRVSCDPASSFLFPLLLSVGRVLLGSLFPRSPLGPAGTEDSQMTQVNCWFVGFLFCMKGDARQVWLLPWRGHNNPRTPRPATCLSVGSNVTGSHKKQFAGGKFIFQDTHKPASTGRTPVLI